MQVITSDSLWAAQVLLLPLNLNFSLYFKFFVVKFLDPIYFFQWNILQKVMDLLMVGVHHARTLLIHYHWNVDKLVTVFVDKDKDHLFAEAGVKMLKCPDLGTYVSPSSTLFCHVCMENVQFNTATQMDCQHSFCNDCKFLISLNLVTNQYA